METARVPYVPLPHSPAAHLYLPISYAVLGGNARVRGEIHRYTEPYIGIKAIGGDGGLERLAVEAEA